MRKILRGHVFNKRFLFTLCLGLTLFFEAHAQVSGTFTINSLAPASASNFQTFSAAVASLSGGVNGAVVFNVQSGSGPYNEQVIINNISGTSVINTITFNCNGVTLTFLSANSNQRAGVKLNGTDYVTFDNLTVLPLAINDGEYGYGFHLLNDADHNTIKNCRITNNINYNYPENHEGIVINGDHGASFNPGYSNCDDNLIQGNTISGGSAGITMVSIPPVGNPAQYITGNKIVNNVISNASLYGIQLSYNGGSLIDGNDITGGPDAVGEVYGIYINTLNQSLVVTKNRIHNFHIDNSISGSRLYGIMIASESQAGKELLIANNLIYDFQNNGHQYGIASRNAIGSFFNLYHNTISLDDQVIAGNRTYGLYFEQISDVNVMNNIVTVSRKTTAYKFGIYFVLQPDRFVSNRNDFYVPATPSIIYAVARDYNGVECTTITDWQKTSGFDYYSTDINPLYTNLAGFDFRPTAQGLDNMAKYVSVVNSDINVAARSTTNPDVGCFEFTSAACASSITGGTTTVLPDSNLCAGPQIYLSIKGNSAGSGQTYTWQTSTTQTGTYTNATGPLTYPVYEPIPSTTLYYRVAITCGANTAYSAPIRILVNTVLNAGTYTINSALPTGGINFNSFRDVTLAMQCGINGPVVFNVTNGSGPYNEQMIIPAVNTSPTKTVTFNGNGATIAFAPTDSDESAVIKLNGADYITIDSLNVNVNKVAGFGFGIQFINDADHNTIRRCKIKLGTSNLSDTSAGIVMSSNAVNPIDPFEDSYCDSNLIAGNTVIGGYYGLTCTSNSNFADSSSTVGNIFRKNILLDNCRYGIYIAGTKNMLIDSNDISHPTRTVFTSNPFRGIYVFEVNYGLTISRNKIHNLLEKVKTSNLHLEGINLTGVEASAAKPNIISNNLIYNFKGNGIQYGIYIISTGHPSQYQKLYHNTVSLDDSASKPVGSAIITSGLAVYGSVQPGNEFKNNSIVIKRGGSGPKYGIYLNTNDNVSKVDYNNYYLNNKGTGTSNTGYMQGINYPALTNWLAARKDTNSISIDPVYHDVANGDLTPTKIPFENKGINVGISKDIWEVTRNTTKPDIGAFEFTICRNLTAPVLTTEETGVNMIRFGWQAVQNTSGYRVSRDGVTWTIPSSGAMGTTHTITGLKPRDTVGLMVKALGSRVDCPEYYSQRVVDTALADGVFVPNTFTPNGNGQNDEFKVYSNVMKSVHWMIFNQWGEKVFETSEIQGTWDGKYKSKPQPVGVYVYVVAATLVDGTKITKKGTFNLVR